MFAKRFVSSVQAELGIMGGVAPTLCTDLNTGILYQIRCVQVGGEVRTLQSGDAALHISPMSPPPALHTLTISYLQIFSGNVYLPIFFRTIFLSDIVWNNGNRYLFRNVRWALVQWLISPRLQVHIVHCAATKHGPCKTARQPSGDPGLATPNINNNK